MVPARAHERLVWGSKHRVSVFCVTQSTEYLCHLKHGFMTTGIFCILPLLFVK
jgi:hypothetical protein